VEDDPLTKFPAIHVFTQVLHAQSIVSFVTVTVTIPQQLLLSSDSAMRPDESRSALSAHARI